MIIRQLFMIESELPKNAEINEHWIENLEWTLNQHMEGKPHKIIHLPLKALKRKILMIGDIQFINGGLTKIEIINWAYENKPLCEILEKGPHSKFKIGQIVELNRRYLYPIQGKGPKKYKGRRRDNK